MDASVLHTFFLVDGPSDYSPLYRHLGSCRRIWPNRNALFYTSDGHLVIWNYAILRHSQITEHSINSDKFICDGAFIHLWPAKCGQFIQNITAITASSLY